MCGLHHGVWRLVQATATPRLPGVNLSPESIIVFCGLRLGESASLRAPHDQRLLAHHEDAGSLKGLPSSPHLVSVSDAAGS